jgi:hypothetical protein
MDKEAALPVGVKELAEAIIQDLAEIKSKLDPLEKLKKLKGKELLPMLVAFEVKKHVMEDVGTVYQKTSSGSKIDSTKLRQALALKGVDTDIIVWAIMQATSSWSTEYVEFRGVKSK